MPPFVKKAERDWETESKKKASGISDEKFERRNLGLRRAENRNLPHVRRSD